MRDLALDASRGVRSRAWVAVWRPPRKVQPGRRHAARHLGIPRRITGPRRHALGRAASRPGRDDRRHDARADPPLLGSSTQSPLHGPRHPRTGPFRRDRSGGARRGLPLGAGAYGSVGGATAGVRATVAAINDRVPTRSREAAAAVDRRRPGQRCRIGETKCCSDRAHLVGRPLGVLRFLARATAGITAQRLASRRPRGGRGDPRTPRSRGRTRGTTATCRPRPPCRVGSRRAAGFHRRLGSRA
jgi:hypothetical protein